MQRIRTSTESGFSLVEVSMSIMISGLIFTMVLAMMRPLQVNIPIEQTTITLREVETALKMHVERYGRLPCPARLNAAPNDPEYGQETDCMDASTPSGIFVGTGEEDAKEIRVGMVPIRNLDLPEYYARDGWDNRLTYAVTTDMAIPGLFSNLGGDISIRDSAGNDMTDVPGSALFAVISHGPDKKGAFTLEGGVAFDCMSSSDLDAENCDFSASGTTNGIFVSTTRSDGLVHYDDMIVYKTYVGNLSVPDCGNRGMIHAPGHPEADASECLDPGYKSAGIVSVDGTADLPCTSNGSFCESGYIHIADLAPGDYLIHWDANLRFNHPQANQYAILEFKAGDIIHETEAMPFTGPVCNLEPHAVDPAPAMQEVAAPIQHESGLMRFNLDELPDARLEVRMRFFGGSNSPGTTCADAVPPFSPLPTPTLSLIQVGTGGADATETLTLDILRKPQTFGVGLPP